MIGVVVPVHNEERLLGPCLRSLRRAAANKALRGELVRVLVVLDACSDDSLEVSRTGRAEILEISARNVGIARQAGARRLLAEGARWLAFTDADSTVDSDWLVAQLDLAGRGADAVCGCVTVDDWSAYAPAVRERYEATYQYRDGHRHVHGANLGVSAPAFVQAGGFRPLACSEDVALVEDLESTGACIAWSRSPRVQTSARRQARAADGFSNFLVAVERALMPITSGCADAAAPASTR